MTKTMKTLITYIFLLMGITFASAQKSPENGAKIRTERDSSMLKVTGVYTNESEKPVKLSYKLKMERSGKSGTSSSSQGGQFEAKAGEEKELSVSSINISEGDSLKLHLSITDPEGKLVAEKTLEEEIK